jgi:hypothetical protein
MQTEIHGSKAIVASEGRSSKVQLIQPPTKGGTLSMNSKFIWSWDVPSEIDGYRHLVLNDIKLRFKCKNLSTTSGVTWTYENLANLMQRYAALVNGNKTKEIPDNLTKFIYMWRLMKLKHLKDLNKRQLQLSNSAGPDIHEPVVIAYNTTSDYLIFSFNWIDDTFHDLHLEPCKRIGIEFDMFAATGTDIYDYLTYDANSSGEALSSYLQLSDAEMVLDIQAYEKKQTWADPYKIPSRDYMRIIASDKTAYNVTSASQEYTVYLNESWIGTPDNIKNIIIYGCSAASSSANTHRQYKGLGIINRMALMRNNHTLWDWYSQEELIDQIHHLFRVENGESAHYLLSNTEHSYIVGENVPLVAIHFAKEFKFKGENRHVPSGGSGGSGLKLVLYNDDLTDADMDDDSRLYVVIETYHETHVSKRGKAWSTTSKIQK